MSEIVRPGGESPFDAIRHVDPVTGAESWDARELQPLLEYAQWRRFEEVIERAKIACKNSKHDVASNFAAKGKVSGSQGPAQKDYDLSRYACYLIAMEADSNKTAVAEAKTYFAVKTRQAELATAGQAFDPSAVTRRDMALMILAAEDRADAEAAARAVAEQKVAELAPVAAAAEALMEAEGSLSMGALANMFKIGRTKLFELLRKEKILQQDRRPYQGYADWFRVTTDYYQDSQGHRHGYFVTRVYMDGAFRLHALLTKRGHRLAAPRVDNQLKLMDGGTA